jgi:hypothetical protein
VSLEGRGATFLMHRRDYANALLYNHSESRHGLQILGCRNISISGLKINGTGGDGIYVAGNGAHVNMPNGSRVYVCHRNESRDITVQGVHCLNNYRQGMSMCVHRFRFLHRARSWADQPPTNAPQNLSCQYACDGL